MAPKDRWDVVYERCFQNQPEGYALYQRVPTTKLKPAMCGYFDSDGDWQTLADLTDPIQLEKLGYTRPIGIAVDTNEEGEGWPLRYSEGVKEYMIKLSGDVE